MKKHLLAFLLTASRLALAETSLLGIDSFAVGKNAGYNGSANRSVFIGPGAGAYINNADSNTVIGAAAALDGNYINSSIAFGHYAMRGATYLDDVVAIGEQAAKSSQNVSDSVFIGKGTANGSYNLSNNVFIGNEIGKDTSDVNNSITIGNGLVPSNNTVNIGGRIICDNNGLKINGNDFLSIDSTKSETIAFRVSTNRFEKSFADFKSGSKWNGGWGTYVDIPQQMVGGTFDWVDDTFDCRSKFSIHDLKVVATKRETSASFDSLKVKWSVYAIGGKRDYDIDIQNGEFDEFTPNVYTGTYSVESAYETLCSFYVNIAINYGYTVSVNKPYYVKYTITVTKNSINILINEKCYTSGWSGEVSTSKNFGFTLSELTDSGNWKQLSRTVDTVANTHHDTRLITSAGVARSINNKIDGCSLKYEDGALKVYDLNGTLLGTLNL